MVQDNSIIQPTISGDENGQRFYVADLDNNRIEVIHRGGNYIAEWGTLGTGNGQFNGPGSIAVDNNHKLVFVSDIKNNRIEKFDTQGNYIGQWGKLGTANGQFDHPGDIALDPDKEILYVTDIYNNRVQSFYYDGNFINQWGSFGQLDGQFNRPAGITINLNDSLLYVGDTVNNRIQVFDTDGKFVKKWGSLGIGNGQFARPDGIFFEPSEKVVYIADRQNSRIQVFDDQGAFVTSWKVSSGINGVSIKPRDITMDPTGQLYIADKDNSNILVYNISASNVPNELTSQSLKSKTDSSGQKSSGSNSKIGSNDNADKGKKDVKRPNRHCDPSYPDFCIPSPPPDLDCPDISHKNFKVVGSDPHGFDRDGDGIGCESSSTTGVVDENPAESEKGKIQVTYGDVSGYNGKANIEIKNLDAGKTLVNAKINFGKQHASQGDHCCIKTYDFDLKGSRVGDKLGIKVTGGGGSWEDNSGYQLKKGTTKVSIGLDEIGG